MLTITLLFFCIIFSSGLCSMTEAAILSLPLMKARILNDQKIKNSKDLLFIKQNISDTIASIVIVNNAINIVGSIFVGQQVASKFGNQWLGLASTILTFCIIVASEIIPKTIGERYKVRMSLAAAKPLRVLLFIFRPVVLLIMKTAQPFVKDANSPKVTEEEIKMMLRVGRAEGTVEMDEEMLCSRVFKLNDLRAMQIMKPIERMFALPSNRTLGELREKIISSKYSRIVIYGKDPKDIVGIVRQRVLLREIAKDHYDVCPRDLMRDPIFVNWFTKADTLLQMFQAYHQHLFIVQDVEGSNVGIVTMEDVLEELFGEIYDEKDAAKPAKFTEETHSNIISEIKDIELPEEDIE